MALVPVTLHDFFVASSGASAALIGLLFVAVSVAPERIFGTAASGDRTYRASSAFFVLGNGFFISLGALLPQVNLGDVLVVAGIIGLLNTTGVVIDLWQRGLRELGRGMWLATGSFAIYAGEGWNGVALLRRPNAVSVIDIVTYLVLGGYAIGLARAWELVGGRDFHLTLAVFHRGRRGLRGKTPGATAESRRPVRRAAQRYPSHRSGNRPRRS